MARWHFNPEPPADPEEGWPYPDDEAAPVPPEPEPVPQQEAGPADRFMVRQDPICHAFGHTQDRSGYGACPSCGGDWPW